MNRESFFEENSALKKFVEEMPGGFFIYHADAEEKIIYANKITLQIFGCETFEEFLQTVHGSFKGLVHPDDYAQITDSINRQVAENESKLDYVAYRIIRRDGMIRYVDDYGRLVHTESHGDVYYVFIRDITEVYEERRENTRRANVIDALGGEYSAIFLFNLAKDLIKPYRLKSDLPRKFAEEFNLNSTGFMSRRKMFETFAEKYIFPDDRDKILLESSAEQIIDRIKSERSYNITFRYLNDDRQLFYVEMTVVGIEEDNFKYVVIGFRNITNLVNRAKQEIQ